MDTNKLLNEDSCFYSKADLIYSYNWNDIHFAKDGSAPENALMDFSQGTHVLYIINLFAYERNFCTRPSGIKIEKMLHLYLPSNIRRKADVMQWIEERWFDYM